MSVRWTAVALLLAVAELSQAATIRVPQDHDTIQAAIDASQPGDTVLVAPGRYRERIQLRPNVTVRSDGDETRGEIGLARAEATILDGGGGGDRPGVTMAKGATLDGFTVTNVGQFDEALWQRHYDSHGEELGDDEGSVQAEGTIPAIRIESVDCSVINSIVHHNGDVGIAASGERPGPEGSTGNESPMIAVPVIANNVAYRNLGGGIGVADLARPIVRGNVCYENLRAGIGCRNASPMIVGNTCFHNIRAGIGCREGATPVIRDNKCYQNRRAGIGIRMPKTAPLVAANQCYENDMAGIGSRDGAEPVIRGNECYRNKMAGIGADGSRPTIVENHCHENEMAGIGLRGQADAVLRGNRCIENKLVAIGVTAGSTAIVERNELLRTGGMPPLVAVKDGSSATVSKNRFTGGGVAGLLIQGDVTAVDNQFAANNPQQGNAIWIWEGSTANIAKNQFDGYRAAVNATKSVVAISDNRITGFSRVAIVVKGDQHPSHVYGNLAFADDSQAQAVDIQGPTGIVRDNEVRATSVQTDK